MIGRALFIFAALRIGTAINSGSSPPVMDRQFLSAHFEELLPPAVKWAAEQEQQILRDGVALSESEIADAKALGVREPERVRLLQVANIPRPSDAQLAAAADAMQFLTPATRGLTLQYGIFIRADCWRERSLVVHELVHTAQYERLGGIAPFLRKYLLQCLTVGYSEAPFEKEAIDLAARHCPR